MAVPVDIYVTDESPSPVPLSGVDVSVYVPGTHVFVGSAVTDVNGLAALSLSGVPTPGTPYEVRFYKLGVNFHGLRTIEVREPAVVGFPNKFDHTGADSNVLPLSGSPLLCRCTGVFVDFRGRPMQDMVFRISTGGENLSEYPKIWDGKMVAPDTIEVRTDVNGRVSVDLLRTGKYDVTFPGDEDQTWCIEVPDRDAADLIALIHPFPAVWDWNDTDAPLDTVSVAVEETKEVNLLVTLTSHKQINQGLESTFDFINSDPTVFSANYDSGSGKFYVRGIAAGTATLTPQLKPNLIPTFWPIPPVVLPPLAITVTP